MKFYKINRKSWIKQMSVLFCKYLANESSKFLILSFYHQADFVRVGLVPVDVVTIPRTGA